MFEFPVYMQHYEYGESICIAIVSVSDNKWVTTYFHAIRIIPLLKMAHIVRGLLCVQLNSHTLSLARRVLCTVQRTHEHTNTRKSVGVC